MKKTEPKEIETFYPENQKAWRKWLQKHHQSKESVWLIMYKLKSGKPSIQWSQAVDEALCFGWIDSKAKSIDDEKYMQFFSKRKSGGTWSKINKDKIEILIAEGRMVAAGFESIALAKQNGSWTILDSVEALEIPKDLARAFRAHQGSKAFYEGLSKSVKKGILYWIISAKQAETRQKRIDEVATLAAQGMRPKHI